MNDITQQDAEKLAAALGEQTGQIVVALLAIARALKPQEPAALLKFQSSIQALMRKCDKDKELQRMILESVL